MLSLVSLFQITCYAQAPWALLCATLKGFYNSACGKIGTRSQAYEEKSCAQAATEQQSVLAKRFNATSCSAVISACENGAIHVTISYSAAVSI